MAPSPKHSVDATTLGESAALFDEEGFTSQFAAAEDGQVLCFTCHKRTPAIEMDFGALRRSEGVSDPSDMVAIVAVTCGQCQAKGTLVLKYGAEATPEEADVLRLLGDGRDVHSGGVSTTDASGGSPDGN